MGIHLHVQVIACMHGRLIKTSHSTHVTHTPTGTLIEAVSPGYPVPRAAGYRPFESQSDEQITTGFQIGLQCRPVQFQIGPQQEVVQFQNGGLPVLAAPPSVAGSCVAPATGSASWQVLLLLCS